ncbi:MAG: hypothetical protein QM758_22250 [Armatimonas sp.]
MKNGKELATAILIPLGLALSPVLSVWKSNRAEVPFPEIFRPLCVVALAALLVSGILRALLYRRTEPWHRTALLASAFWLMFWNYSFIRDKFAVFAVLASPDALLYPDKWGLPLWIILALVVLVALSLVKRWLPAITSGLAAMAAVLVVLALPWQGLGKAARPTPAPSPVPQVKPRPANDNRPDIYVVVLDGYARTDVLRNLHQCDNTEFLEGLKSRGFQVAAHSQANYVQTALALGSLLRMDYWPAEKSDDAVSALTEMVGKAPLREFVAAHNYRSIAYLSSGPLTEGLLQETIIDMGEASSPIGSLENLLLDITPLAILPRGEAVEYANHRQRLRNTLKRLGEPPPSSDPYLVLCHILLPHPPFVFGPNGEERTPPIPYSIGDATGYRGKGEEYGQAYSDQVQWVGPQVLNAIDSLRKNSPRPVAILLMGDHGSRRYTDWSGAEHTYMPEAFGNLLAVCVPDELKSRFGILPNHPTPLTTFRRLLNATLNEKLPPLPDHSYYSTLNKGFTFVDVTEAARAPVSVEEAKRVHPSIGR